MQFANGVKKLYDVKPLAVRFPAFTRLEDESLFGSVEVGQGGCGVVWSDDVDLSCDELWENGAQVGVGAWPSTAVPYT